MMTSKTDALMHYLFLFIEFSYFSFSRIFHHFISMHIFLSLQIAHNMNLKVQFLFVITFIISAKVSYTSQSNPIIAGNKNEIKSQEKIDIIGGVSGVLGQIGNIGNGGINTIINQNGMNRNFLSKNIYHI